MEKKYTSEEHDRCKRVAEAFQELYDLYGDMCMVDAGEFGFVHLLWFWKGNFDSSICYHDSRKMFDDLWELWLDYMLLEPVKNTELSELSSEELYDMLPEETKVEYQRKRQQFLAASGLSD